LLGEATPHRLRRSLNPKLGTRFRFERPRKGGAFPQDRAAEPLTQGVRCTGESVTAHPTRLIRLLSLNMSWELTALPVRPLASIEEGIPLALRRGGAVVCNTLLLTSRYIGCYILPSGLSK
jgi:hypothetical protein